MKLIKALAVGVVLMLLASCSSSREDVKSETPGVTDDRIRLGMTAPLTGPGATYGDFAKGMTAYFESLNAKGGINGRQIELIVRDDAYDPAKTLTEASRLVKTDEVLALVGGVGGATQSAIAESNNRDGVPTLLSITGLDSLVAPPLPFVSVLQPTYGLEARLWADYINQNHAGAKVGLLYQNDDSGRVVQKVLDEEFGERVVAQGYDTTDADVSTQITALRQEGAEVVLFASAPKFSTLGLLAIERQGWEVPRFISSVGFDPSVAQNAGTAAEGVVTTLSVRSAYDEEDPIVKEINDVVRSHGGGVEPNQWTLVGVTNAMIIAEILEVAGEDLDRESLMKAHDSLVITAEGPWFGTVELSQEDRVALGCLQIVEVAGESMQPVGDALCE